MSMERMNKEYGWEIIRNPLFDSSKDGGSIIKKYAFKGGFLTAAQIAHRRIQEIRSQRKRTIK